MSKWEFPIVLTNTWCKLLTFEEDVSYQFYLVCVESLLSYSMWTRMSRVVLWRDDLLYCLVRPYSPRGVTTTSSNEIELIHLKSEFFYSVVEDLTTSSIFINPSVFVFEGRNVYRYSLPRSTKFVSKSRLTFRLFCSVVLYMNSLSLMTDRNSSIVTYTCPVFPPLKEQGGRRSRPVRLGNQRVKWPRKFVQPGWLSFFMTKIMSGRVWMFILWHFHWF